MKLGINVKGSSLRWISEWGAEVSVCLSAIVEECFRLGGIPAAGYILWSSHKTASGESSETEDPRACLDVLCVVKLQ